MCSFAYAIPPTNTVVQSSAAEGLDIAYPEFDYLKLNNNYSLEFHVFNKSNGYPYTDKLRCTFHLYDHDSGEHLFEKDYTTLDHTYDIGVDLDGKNFSKLGVYSYIFQCNRSDDAGKVVRGGFVKKKIQVTVDGNEPILPDPVALKIMYGILIAMFLVLTIWTYEKHPYLSPFFISLTFITGTIMVGAALRLSSLSLSPYLNFVSITYKVMLWTTWVIILIVMILLTGDAVKLRKHEGNPLFKNKMKDNDFK